MGRLTGYFRIARRLAGLLAIIAWSMATYALDRRNRRDTTGRALWLQRACRRTLAVFGVSIQFRGQPARAAVVVCNHLSYLDILVITAQTPVVFVSKKEVRGWPVFGWFAERAGTRFIDRGKRGDVGRIAEEIGPVMADGLSVVLFLEGTTTDGGRVLPFRSSLLEPAVEHGWKIVPTALSYAVPPGHSVAREVCWWGDMTLAPHLLNLMTLAWVRAQADWGDAVTAGGDRKALAEELHERVVALKAGVNRQSV